MAELKYILLELLEVQNQKYIRVDTPRIKHQISRISGKNAWFYLFTRGQKLLHVQDLVGTVISLRMVC